MSSRGLVDNRKGEFVAENRFNMRHVVVNVRCQDNGLVERIWIALNTLIQRIE